MGLMKMPVLLCQKAGGWSSEISGNLERPLPVTLPIRSFLGNFDPIPKTPRPLWSKLHIQLLHLKRRPGL